MRILSLVNNFCQALMIRSQNKTFLVARSREKELRRFTACVLVIVAVWGSTVMPKKSGNTELSPNILLSLMLTKLKKVVHVDVLNIDFYFLFVSGVIENSNCCEDRTYV